MATYLITTMECQNIPLPTSRPASPDLSTPCERLIQVQNETRKFTLLFQGSEQSLTILSPCMKADEPEVIDLFARLSFYQEQRQNAECEYGTLLPCTTLGCNVHGTTPTSPISLKMIFRP
ncbi:hypothetical protein TNIN_175381 [Trichonephila inaurata madagascariensis]|uniref:Uncharacterized protein n=1 Tax=Trichonephila inaurata madagascariensis TaxID=2747483 RepID=A0A8X7CKB1_9ARAC|nr:hypothetical protein TNIN_175381 [Trichonephila inaurata madagascariensis]